MSQSDCVAKVEIEISDPWEFGTAHGTGPFLGCLIKLFASAAYDADKLAVVKLDAALDFGNVRYEYLLLQSRHADIRVADIESGDKIFCNLCAISETSANALDPLIASRTDPKATVLVGHVIWKRPM